MTAPPSCAVLEWDSEFFGRRIARVQGGRLDAEGIARCRSWCAQEGVEALQFLADPNDAETAQAVQAAGFRYVDTRMMLERPIADLAKLQGALPEAIHVGDGSEAAALAEVARVSHRDSRFYHDPGFDRARCDDLYATWVKNSFEGFAQAVLVATHAGQPAGYLSCHLNDDDTGQIGLVAVGEAARGHGLGGKLVEGSLAWFANAGKPRAVVVTQGRNVAALRMYERLGFLTHSVGDWYHLWLHGETP